jgi:hypothetical protein
VANSANLAMVLELPGGRLEAQVEEFGAHLLEAGVEVANLHLAQFRDVRGGLHQTTSP